MFDPSSRKVITPVYIPTLTSIVCGLILGIFISYLFSVSGKTTCVSGLHFIKPNIDCTISEQKMQNLTDLEKKMSILVEGYKNSGMAKRVSIFVRDLKSSRFAGIDDNDVYYMASLLKTPLIIGGYKLAEVEPKILDQEIKYKGVPNLYDEQVVKSDEKLKLGSSYSIKELMRRAIVYSDNTAAQILFDYYPKEFMDRIMQALGIQITRPTGENENLMTARTYSNVFRLLYNTSYLTPEYSNDALSILTQTVFNKGATAKLPKSVIVAHKFAERTIRDPSNSQLTVKQFHECGIVYAKDGIEPYTFCIMTEGSNYEDLESVIRDISLEIYDSMIINGGGSSL
jgi:hypothetical protein